MKNLQNRKYGIFGLGASGLATIEFLSKKSESLVAWDDNQDGVEKAKSLNANCDFFPIDHNSWTSIDILILSPGVPLHFPLPHPIVNLARKHNIEIICDIELFYRHYPSHKYIGITGTNGKSTTTALIGHILQQNKIAHKTAGNIGVPILSIQPKKEDIIVLEISSYQLDLLQETKFDIAVLLNITQDHIDRHGTMEEYINAKYKIFNNQTEKDCAIIGENAEYKNISNIKAKITHISTNQKKQCMSMIPHNIYLQGKHNQENISAALAAVRMATDLGEKEILDSILSFKGLKHRMQFVGKKEKITFINDSKATNFEASKPALRTLHQIYWIAGGVEKSGGINGIEEFKDHINHVFLIGQSKSSFAKTLATHIPYNISSTLEQAFSDAIKLATESNENAVILLSPSAASFDQWKNFEERGNAFTELVDKFINRHE